jgi:cytosine/creatinine deaminase
MTAADLPRLSTSDPFLHAAYEEAMDGYLAGGIPIGSVLVKDGEIIGRGQNRRVQEGNPILHGEMSALQNAGRLSAATYRRCTIYTTQSPCTMCTGAILLFGIPRVVIGESLTSRTPAADGSTLRADNFFGSGQSIVGFLRSRGVQVTVYDDLACHELLQRFASEQPEVWAEDTGTLLPENRSETG